MSAEASIVAASIPWGTVIVSGLFLALQGLLFWGLWSMRKQFASQEALKKLKEKVVALETAQGGMPSDDDIGGIKERLGGIEGEIKAILATVQGQAEIMKRIEHPMNILLEYHLRGNK